MAVFHSGKEQRRVQKRKCRCNYKGCALIKRVVVDVVFWCLCVFFWLFFGVLILSVSTNVHEQRELEWLCASGVAVMMHNILCRRSSSSRVG